MIKYLDTTNPMLPIPMQDMNKQAIPMWDPNDHIYPMDDTMHHVDLSQLKFKKLRTKRNNI